MILRVQGAQDSLRTLLQRSLHGVQHGDCMGLLLAEVHLELLW